MSFLRIPFMLTATWGFHIVMTSPSVLPAKDKLKLAKHVNFNERLFRASIGLNCILNKYSTWGICLCEAAVVLAHTYPTHSLAQHVLNALTWGDVTTAENIGLSPAFLILWFLVIFGSFVRWLSYRALGRHFTFEGVMHKDHQLVTWGPYAVVRHPGYIGGWLCILCVLPVVFGSGSWFWECGVSGTLWGKAVAAVSMFSRLYIVYSTMRSTQLEDRLLGREFGEQWDRWAERVPYKWVPGIW